MPIKIINSFITTSKYIEHIQKRYEISHPATFNGASNKQPISPPRALPSNQLIDNWTDKISEFIINSGVGVSPS